MTSDLIPANISQNNVYTLKLKFENETNERYWIHTVQLDFPEWQISLSKQIEIELSEPILGFIKREIYISFPFKLEKDFVLPHQFIIRLLARKLIKQKWSNEFTIEWAPQSFQLRLKPIYNVFISRSIRKNENEIPSYFTQLIERWGYKAFTLGVHPFNRQYSNEELLQTIKMGIEQADIVFAITTKRDQLLKNWQWRTFEWLQNETAIGYILNKQILVFVEKGVELSGLASKRVVLQFDSQNSSVFDAFFDQNMPKIRQYIAERRNTKFLYNFLKGITIIGGITLIGAAAFQLGKISSDIN